MAALVGNAVACLSFTVGGQHGESATAGMLTATIPLWTVTIARGTGHQRAVPARQVAGLVIGFGGAALLLALASRLRAGLDRGDRPPGAAACYSVSYVYMDRFLACRGIGPVVLSACQLGAPILLAITLGVTGAPAARLDAPLWPGRRVGITKVSSGYILGKSRLPRIASLERLAARPVVPRGAGVM